MRVLVLPGRAWRSSRLSARCWMQPPPPLVRCSSNAAEGHVPVPWFRSAVRAPRDPTTPPSVKGGRFDYNPVHVSLEHYLNPPTPTKDANFAYDMNQLTPPEEMVKRPELFAAHCQEGHVRREWHPRMSQFILGTRSGMHIIDLNESLARLRRAIKVTQGIGLKRGKILFITTRPLFTPIIMQQAISCGQPFLVDKWVPGLLTNFTQVRGAISRQENLLEEQGVRFSKRKPRTARRILGLHGMKSHPDLLFVVNVKENACAIREAQAANVPVMGLVDTDCDPQDITWPIPVNDDHIASVGLICEKIASGVRQAVEFKGEHIDRSAIEFEDPDGNVNAMAMPDEKLLIERLIKRRVS